MKPLLLLFSLPLAAQVNVLTYQYDNTRAGANTRETVLTPRNVSADHFGKLFSYPVDGYIYGQPLHLGNVSVPDQGTYNVVYVATEHDSVYAFDADGKAAGPLWHVNFLGPGVTSVPYEDVGCDQIIPEIGITGTPVIDQAGGTIYVVAMTKETPGVSTRYVHRLHALDVATGAERSGSPVEIAVSVEGTGDGGRTVVLDPIHYKQRPGLLLLNGVVYVGMSSHCDGATYHGWLIGYDAHTLAQVTVFNNTPDGSQGSFWAGGAAPAVDESGNIYLVAGNGTFDAAFGGRDLGESYIKLSSGGGLRVADYFAPFNAQDLSIEDTDVGSAGVALLGDEAGSTEHPHLAIGAGKEGRIYVLDRDNMGRWQAGSDSQIVASTDAYALGGLFGNPAYFNQLAYLCGPGNPLWAWTVADATLSKGPVAQSPTEYGYPGCLPTISANGTADAIVWTLDPANILHAYDAGNVGIELYNSDRVHARDALGPYVKFTAPAVANGKVYAGTETELDVYGPLAGQAPGLVVANAASGERQVAAPGSIISIFGTFPGGAPVTINDKPATVLEAGRTQIRALVPPDTPTGMATLAVGGTGSASVMIQSVAPGLFLNRPGRAAALNEDATVNAPGRPASAGSEIALYLTGLGTSTDISVTVGGEDAAVAFVGAAPGFKGLDQVNVIVPQVQHGPGDYPIQVKADGVASNSGVISVR